MKASILLQQLQALITKYGDLQLVYSVDDEGNGFDKVKFPACAGILDGETFTSTDDLEDEVPTHICIN